MGSTAALPEGARPLNALMADTSPVFDTYQTMPDDTAVILYTSGTTGRPKGAELSHFNMFFNAYIGSEKILQTKPEEIGLAVLPLFHSFGQTCVMNALLYAGATMTLLPRFEPQKALEVMARDKVSFFAGVPTMYWTLLLVAKAGGVDTTAIARHIRLCASGGAAMPLEIMRAFEATFSVRIVEGYGLSETSPVACFNQLHRPSRPGTVGLPIFGVDVRCVDEEDRFVPAGQPGEIVIRGPNVMKGYFGRPDATDEVMRHGWFHTGDIGSIDADGYVTIVDRKKDMVIRGGFNVYPREIEEVLLTHPGVALAAVLGVPDERLGEEVKAAMRAD